ncbi:MAG: hypothetical protein Q4D98_13585 [Planctomycetia bacterium]|nr:hypothetical protein [Planctomycetia bacterium]
MKRRGWMVLLVGLFAVPVFAEGTLQVGACRVDSTPTHLPAVVNGGFTPQFLDVVNDPLSIRALVVDDGTTCVAYAVADVCVLPENIVEAAKDEICRQIPIPREQIAMSSTHCHSAPSLMKLLGTDVDSHYVPLFQKKMVEAVVTAYARRQPAKMGYGFDFDPENVYCRRFLMKPGKALHVNPEFTGAAINQAQMNPNADHVIRRLGVPDPTVYVVAFQTPEGKPLALLANYSTHYAGAPNLSADYFGVFCREIAEKLGADASFTALMTNGTSGDTNCIDRYNRSRKFTMETVGKSVAEAAMRAYQKMTFTSEVTLSMRQEKLTVALRKGTLEQVALAKKHGAEHPVVKTMEDAYALNTLQLAEMPDTRDLTLQTIRLGEVGIALLPNEVYSATGHEIRRNSPHGMTFVISMANGYAGYLPTKRDIELGGYTTWRATSSCCEPGAEEKIRMRLIKMLEEIRP